MAESCVAFLVGLILGSFVNVVITRLPQGESLWSPRSRCPQCRQPLAW
jgi:leader peptidase (prepilin peptidase)/N-methyltransferase